MKLSIITINYNNAYGLQQTLASVASQIWHSFEHIIVDGASSDDSVHWLRQYEKEIDGKYPVLWSSEKDRGIYHAMNKGISRATGEYLLFLNSGDCLADASILETVMTQDFEEDVLYGHLRYVTKDSTYINYAPQKVTLRTFLNGTIYHSGAAFIRKDAFEKWGLYDETLRIVSDWKWFLQTVGLGIATVRFMDIVLSNYDGTGISETQIEKVKKERQEVLNHIIPPRMLMDLLDYENLEAKLIEQAAQIRNSTSYRVGTAVLHPIRLIKKFLCHE